MLRFNLNLQGFGGGDEGDEVLWGELGRRYWIVEEVRLFLRSFIEGDSDGDAFILEDDPQVSYIDGDGGVGGVWSRVRRWVPDHY